MRARSGKAIGKGQKREGMTSQSGTTGRRGPRGHGDTGRRTACGFGPVLAAGPAAHAAGHPGAGRAARGGDRAPVERAAAARRPSHRAGARGHSRGPAGADHPAPVAGHARGPARWRTGQRRGGQAARGPDRGARGGHDRRGGGHLPQLAPAPGRQGSAPAVGQRQAHPEAQDPAAAGFAVRVGLSRPAHRHPVHPAGDSARGRGAAQRLVVPAVPALVRRQDQRLPGRGSRGPAGSGGIGPAGAAHLR